VAAAVLEREVHSRQLQQLLAQDDAGKGADNSGQSPISRSLIIRDNSGQSPISRSLIIRDDNSGQSPISRSLIIR
jgi:hypothetical protein